MDRDFDFTLYSYSSKKQKLEHKKLLRDERNDRREKILYEDFLDKVKDRIE